jgi:RecA/RadA recombinase
LSAGSKQVFAAQPEPVQVVSYQKNTDGPVAIFDFERTTKSWYLSAMGINESMAFVKRPDSIEDAVKDAIDLMGQGVRMFTFDSIPRMRSKVEASEIKNGNAFKVQPGTHARSIQQFYDIMLPHIAGVDGTLWMVNQTRSRIEMSQEAKNAAAGYAIFPAGFIQSLALCSAFERFAAVPKSVSFSLSSSGQPSSSF